MSTAEADWERLDALYRSFVVQIRHKDPDEVELAYLRSAFLFTEELWGRAFDGLRQVNLVLLSEAPEFGDNMSYIYNPQTPHTSFIYLEDLSDGGRYRMTQIAKKLALLERMKDLGVLVLDLFPYALNGKNTRLRYSNLRPREYAELFKAVAPSFLRPKLRRIRDKLSPGARFVYRYNRLRKRSCDGLLPIIRELDLVREGSDLGCIGGKNMPMDRSALWLELGRAGVEM